MTRFARAKGSKASNERAPEDSTPWEVMKEQLMQSKKEKEEASKRREAENQRITNYENFLKEQKVSKRKATWCDFPEESAAKKRLLPPKQPSSNNQETISNGDANPTEATSPVSSNKKKKKNKNKKSIDIEPVAPNADVKPTETLSETGTPQPGKKQKKKKNKKSPGISLESSSEVLQTSTLPEIRTVNSEKKRKKKDKKSPGISSESSSEVLQTSTLPEFRTVNSEKKRKKNDKKEHKANNSIDNTAETEHIQESTTDRPSNKNNSKPIKDNDNIMKKKRKGKIANGKALRRKEINDKSFQLIINTKEVELVRFDGFPIMKKDAERLAELRKSMIQKGIPKSEVQRTMKLERRRAEKALARLKREVCYNCRKGGHNLSDCPELKSKIPGVDAAEGICFKCGSTEHRQFECKVQRDNEFRFATCFICREQGHLARQCPDNPKGLYPNGGSCKLCGDVTHLRKDCPTGQREETSLKLGTLESTDNIEDIGQQVKLTSAEPAKKQPKKIKF